MSLSKPTVFGIAFDHEPGFKTENLIKYRIQCRLYGGACSVCVRGATTKACATLFWAIQICCITENSIHKTTDVIVSKIDYTF